MKDKKYMVKITLCFIEKWNYVRPSLSQPKKYNTKKKYEIMISYIFFWKKYEIMYLNLV